MHFKKYQAVIIIVGFILTVGICAASYIRVPRTGGIVTIEEQDVPLYSKPETSNVLTPVAGGTVVYSNAKSVIDASNLNQGYVMVKYKGNKSKIKVQVIKSSGESYNYDIQPDNNYEVFPLSEGDGAYTVRVLENVSGNQYSIALSQDISVALQNEFLPFLYPNQYVKFSANSAAITTGSQISSGITDQLQLVTAIYNYVVGNFTYDNVRAATVQSGYLPDVDKVLQEKKGICFDYAAVMTAMLRSQNIPTKLVVGYTGDLYHAWINVYIEGEGWIDNVIYFDGHDWTLMDPTFASSGGKSEEIMKYIANKANYKQKYSY